jgi:alpha-L-fucosidase
VRIFTDDFLKKLISVVPDERQLRWQRLEFYGFIHYGVNTFTDREWGDGTEDEAVFNPTAQDADQWAEAFKNAGMKGLILTAKHHDGFCLWPSRFTEHSVKNSPFRGGRGDVVMEAAKACEKAGIKFGVYLSPWDRNSRFYGDSPAYNAYYKNQLTELLTGYGELFSVWFDGACGEGPNGKRQVYDFEGYYELIRKYQPQAVITVCGPDVRWCGNEAGRARRAEWSVVPKRLLAPLQEEEKRRLALRDISCETEDLGSREALKNEPELIWYPAETDTSIRRGWFYHQSDDDTVRSAEEIVEIYENTVGGNSSLLLNVPPDRRGILHEKDVESLEKAGKIIRDRYAGNLIEKAAVNDGHGKNIKPLIAEDSYDAFWKNPDGEEKAEIYVTFDSRECVSRLVLRENIRLSQRIEGVKLYAVYGEDRKLLGTAENVGSKKIIGFESVCADKFLISVEGARLCPTLSFIGLYR